MNVAEILGVDTSGSSNRDLLPSRTAGSTAALAEQDG